MLPSLWILPEITIKNKRQISHFCVLIEEKKNRRALCDRYNSSNKVFSSSLIQHMPFIWINTDKSSYLKGFHFAIFFITALPKGPVKSYP